MRFSLAHHALLTASFSPLPTVFHARSCHGAALRVAQRTRRGDGGCDNDGPARGFGGVGGSGGGSGRFATCERGGRLATSAAAVVAGCGEVPADPQVRALPQPRSGVCAQGPQALLPLEGLPVRQVHAHRRAPARHGGAGGAAQATGAGRERGARVTAPLRHCRGPGAGRRQRHHPAATRLRGLRLCVRRRRRGAGSGSARGHRRRRRGRGELR